MDHGGFNLIVERRGGAVSINVSHVTGLKSGLLQRHRDCPFRAQTFRMRRGHMPGVGRFSGAQQRNVCGFTGQQDQCRRFADIDAITILSERRTTSA
ncbi:hypothetical protein D3C80_1745150 [compost metagenome]